MTGFLRRKKHILILMLGFIIASTPIIAATNQHFDLGGSAHYVNQGEIYQSLLKASGNPELARVGASLSHNVENGSGDLALSNGTYIGLFQMGPSEISAYSRPPLTTTQFAQSDSDTQAATWVRYLAANMRSVQSQLTAQGPTFDGQPIDSAFRVACVQLGTGNCRAMLKAGSCSARADANGTTICAMAAKIRGSSTSDPNNTLGANNILSDADMTQNAGYSNVGGTTMALGSTSYCWSCDAIVYALAIMDSVCSNGIPTLTSAITPLLFVWFAIALCWSFITAIAAGYSPLTGMIRMIIRFAVVSAVLIAGSGQLANIMFNDVLDPILNTSATLGNSLAEKTNDAIGTQFVSSSTKASLTQNQDNASAGTTQMVQLFNITPVQGDATKTYNNDCIYNASASITLTHLLQTEAATTSLACTIHHIDSNLAAIGITMMSMKSDSTTKDSVDLPKLGINAAGALISTSAMIGMLRFGTMVLDIIVELACISAFLPWIIYCYIYRSTQGILYSYFKRIGHSALTLVISGLTCVVGLFCLMVSLYYGADIDPTDATKLPLQIALVMASVQDKINAFSPIHPSTWAGMIKFTLFAYAGSSFANAMMEQSIRISSQITGISVSSSLSSAVSATISAAMRMGTHAAPAMASPAIGRAGNILGSLLGGAKR